MAGVSGDRVTHGWSIGVTDVPTHVSPMSRLKTMVRGEGTRTPDLCDANAALSQLSYIPTGGGPRPRSAREVYLRPPAAGPNGTTGSPGQGVASSPNLARRALRRSPACSGGPIRREGCLVRLLPIALSVLVGMALVFFVKLRQRAADVGCVPGDANRPLAGDDLIPDAGIVDTRSLVIDAPPSAVWPWLVQLGFGRGGWYSYDRLDMSGSSADRILPEFQDLARR